MTWPEGRLSTVGGRAPSRGGVPPPVATLLTPPLSAVNNVISSPVFLLGSILAERGLGLGLKVSYHQVLFQVYFLVAIHVLC